MKLNLTEVYHEKQMKRYMVCYLKAERWEKKYRYELEREQSKMRDGKAFDHSLIEHCLTCLGMIEQGKEDLLNKINKHRAKIGNTPMYINNEGHLTLVLNDGLDITVSFYE